MFLAFHEATRGLEITPPRFTALVIVGANPGISQTALGRVLGIARSGAMMLTDWMEDRGLAERRQRPDDGRAWGLHLTARGEKLVARMKRRVLAEDRRRAARLGTGERRILLALLKKLAG
jgi:DNA-binding MarR family transcriptional regulator